MEAARHRNIRSGAEFDHLFPAANEDTHTILTDAGVSDTVSFIPKVVNDTLDHTRKIARILKGHNDYDTCRNIWHFVYNHIAYRKDKAGYEQVRSPARTWHDRAEGVDCDCYTTFISSILTNLHIPHLLRITKYNKPFFQHIYPVVVKNGRKIIIDCVTDKFDYEVPYSEKKDHPMDLQYLDGLDAVDLDNGRLFDGSPGMEELGKVFKKKGGGSAPKKKTNIFKKIGAAAKKVGKGIAKAAKKINLKKVLNAVNKVNPVTLALRNGLLAGMKLNVGNVAKRMRWAYITPEQAQAKGLVMDRWNKLVGIRKKLENIFYDAGGKPENLKKAILNGKGNSDKAVHGFDGLDGFGELYDVYTPLPQLLGPEVFYGENEVGMLGELGEPVTLAVVAAASAAIATIAKLIKKIGDIFGGKGKDSEDFDEAKNEAAEKEIAEVDKQAEEAGVKPQDPLLTSAGGEEPSETSGKPASGRVVATQAGGKANVTASVSDGGADTSEASTSVSTPGSATKSVAAKMEADTATGDDGTGNETFWQKHKKWLLPVAIGVGGLALVAIAMAASKSGKPAQHDKPMHGIPGHKNHHRKKSRKKAAAKTKHGKKREVALI